jgi:hypothetical protein
MYSLWITFDRQATLSRYGHTFQYTNTTTAPPATQGNNRSKSVNIPTTSIKKEDTHQLHTSTINHPWTKPVGEYSAQTLKTNIHDYEIMGDLGQGTYGIVKLAYLKNDPEKVNAYKLLYALFLSNKQKCIRRKKWLSSTSTSLVYWWIVGPEIRN